MENSRKVCVCNIRTGEVFRVIENSNEFFQLTNGQIGLKSYNKDGSINLCDWQYTNKQVWKQYQSFTNPKQGFPKLDAPKFIITIDVAGVRQEQYINFVFPINSYKKEAVKSNQYLKFYGKPKRICRIQHVAGKKIYHIDNN